MAGDVVQVGCKSPNGFILDLDKYEVVNKDQGIVRRIPGKMAPVRLRGNAVAFGQPSLAIEGYVFTAVPKDFWDAWLAQNKDSSLLADGFIKPAASLNAGHGMAKEMAKEAGHNEPIKQVGDPRTRGLDIKAYDKDEAA